MGSTGTMGAIMLFPIESREIVEYLGIGETRNENNLDIVIRQVQNGIPGADGRVGPMGPSSRVWGRS